MPEYKHGKQEEIIDFQNVRRQVAEARLSCSEEAYFWILYYCGVRKSEAYERVAEDFNVSQSHLIIDFHKRKKGGAEVDPLKLPRNWPGINKIIMCIEKAEQRKPNYKNLFVYKDKKRVKVRTKARWAFPHIQSTRAWQIVKQVLGIKYYPHFLRLNRLSEIGSDPSANLLRLKSYSGIKSTKSLEAYLGTSEKEQDAAIDFMNSKYKQH